MADYGATTGAHPYQRRASGSSASDGLPIPLSTINIIEVCTMPRTWHLAAIAPFFTLPLFLLAPDDVSAQQYGGLPPWLTIGTPRGQSDRVDTGQANYPGSNGFVPGYGYYPDWNKNRWVPENALYGPWDRAPIQPPLPIASDAPHGAALLRVLVPANADIWFSGAKTTQRGDSRLFVTPEISKGGNFVYEIRARWLVDGRRVEQVKNVRVHEGDRVTVDFLNLENGHDVLPPPRKVP
jgi:uncharacterized protein (TIGR03000 family)